MSPAPEEIWPLLKQSQGCWEWCGDQCLLDGNTAVTVQREGGVERTDNYEGKQRKPCGVKDEGTDKPTPAQQKKKKKVNVRAPAAGKQEETQEAEHLKKHWSHWLQPGCDSITVAILWNCNVYRKDGTFYIPVTAGNFTERAQSPSQGIGTFTEKQRNYVRSERSEHKSDKCFSNPTMLPYCYNNWQ